MNGSKDPGRVLILGCGPTGCGTAWRLEESGHVDYQILEASDRPGGLAASVVDDAGFTWDLGGHVQFSHYSYYDRVLDAAVTDGWLWHARESWVWIDRAVRSLSSPVQHSSPRRRGPRPPSRWTAARRRAEKDRSCAQELLGMDRADLRPPDGRAVHDPVQHQSLGPSSRRHGDGAGSAIASPFLTSGASSVMSEKRRTTLAGGRTTNSAIRSMAAQGRFGDRSAPSSRRRVSATARRSRPSTLAGERCDSKTVKRRPTTLSFLRYPWQR